MAMALPRNAIMCVVLPVVTFSTHCESSSAYSCAPWIGEYEQEHEDFVIRDKAGDISELHLFEQAGVVITDEALRDIAALGTLNKLSLSFQSRHFSSASLEACLQQSKVNELRFGCHTRLDEDIAKAIVRSSSAQRIAVPYCEGVTTPVAELILQSSGLRSVDLTKTEVDSTIANAVNKSPITELILDRSKIADEFVELLDASVPLQTISVAHTAMSGKGVAGLARLQKVREIRCAGINLNEGELRKISGIPTLERIVVGESDISLIIVERVSRDVADVVFQVGDKTIMNGGMKTKQTRGE